MKTMVYAVYDSKTEMYSTPHFIVNKGTALRSWVDAANAPDSHIAKHPGDYTMFEIGTWDDVRGEIVMHHAKISLGTALEFKKAHSGLQAMMQDESTLNGANA